MKDFHAYCCLALNDLRIIKRRDEGFTLLGCKLFCLGICLIKIISKKYNLNVAVAKHPHLLNLLFRGGFWHIDIALDSKFVARKCNSLGMVSGTCANYTCLALLLRQIAYLVVCPSDLIGAYNLQVLPLQHHICTKLAAQIRV